MRAIVIRESLQDGELPDDLHGMFLKAYPHLLDETTEIEIIELAVAEEHALGVAMGLAAVLLPRLYYAHVLGKDSMYVAFPNCITLVRRDQPETADRAQAIGRLFGIPLSHMRFAEMFEVDHPDAAGPARERTG